MKRISVEYHYHNNNTTVTRHISFSVSHYIHALMEKHLQIAFTPQSAIYTEEYYNRFIKLIKGALDSVLCPSYAPTKKQNIELFNCLHAFGYVIMKDIFPSSNPHFYYGNRVFLLDNQNQPNSIMTFHCNNPQTYNLPFQGKHLKTFFSYNPIKLSINRGNNESFIVEVIDPYKKIGQNIETYFSKAIDIKKVMLDSLDKYIAENGVIEIDYNANGVDKILISNKELSNCQNCEDTFNDDRIFIYVLYNG